MSLRQLSQDDFSWWKRYLDKMRNCHEKEFLQEVDPDLMRAFYRGLRRKGSDIEFSQPKAVKKDQLITLSKIFTATNTILPNLYYQNPRKMAIPTRGAPEDSAALMTAVLNHYMKTTRQKEENQEAIMNTWFFGLGWKKIGYHIATESNLRGPEEKLSFQDQAALGIKNILGIEPDQTIASSSSEIVRSETLSSTSEDPVNVLVDHKGDLKNYKVIAHRVERSLYDLYQFGRYDRGVLDEIRDKMEVRDGTRFDLRDIMVILNELMIEQRNGTWILTFIDDFFKPLRYEKMTHEGGIPWEPLMFTHEPGVRYPTSHMKVASRTQEWIDNVANLQMELVGKLRSQFYVNENILSLGQKDAFTKNLIGGIIFGKRAAGAGDIQEMSSRGMTADLFNMLGLFQQNVTEILGADSQRVSGQSANKTATQDQLASQGSQIRESGMLDRIREWLIRGMRLEGQFIKQFSNAQIHLQITPKDYRDPKTGKRIENTWVEFMTQNNPLPLRQYLEHQFDYDTNVYEAPKPNNIIMRQQAMEAMSTLAPLAPALLQSGIKVDIGALAKIIGSSFEHLDPDNFIEELDPQQQALAQASQVLTNNNGVVPSELGGFNQEVQEQPVEQEAAV